MDLRRFNEMLLQSTGVALAIVDPESYAVLFHNRRFGEWFPDVAADGCRLDGLMPGLDLERLAARVAAGRGYVAEAEVRKGRRPIKLAVNVEAHEREGTAVLIVECQNVTKLKELEYMIESYSSMVERQNRDLKKEKERVEKLLLNIMPKTVYEEWKAFGVTTPQRYEASVLMLDFVGFTEMAAAQDPATIIAELNDIFTAFDRIVEQFRCERIKTIGDAYIAVSGIPEPTPEHAQNIAGVALRFLHYLNRRNATRDDQWLCRVGLSSGPVIGSIIGIQKYVYDIFGPSVNLAARMEGLAQPMQITLCDDMYALIHQDFDCVDLGEMEVKGFGLKRLYSLRGGPDLRLGDAGP